MFGLLHCNDSDKILLVEYQLEGNTEHWWRASNDVLFSLDVVIIQENFVNAFNDKYFSDYARDKKVAEFMHLIQGNLTVGQYEAKFVELSRLSPRLVENGDARAK